MLDVLCTAMQGQYGNKSITVSMCRGEKSILLPLTEKNLYEGLSGLMQQVLDLVPAHSSLFVSAGIVHTETGGYCSVQFRNTGINLKIVAGIFKKSYFPVSISSVGQKETLFEVRFPLAINGADTEINGKQAGAESPFNYISVLKGIRTYFSKMQSPADLPAETNPKEGKFLQKVNTVIAEKLSDEHFDANALSSLLAISRAQLLRRLKKLTGISPAQYIKSIRLQKAKEMLETDVTVSEVAYENGFGTLSNFTKVFREKYGITPSQWRQTRPVQQINKK